MFCNRTWLVSAGTDWQQGNWVVLVHPKMNSAKSKTQNKIIALILLSLNDTCTAARLATFTSEYPTSERKQTPSRDKWDQQG